MIYTNFHRHPIHRNGKLRNCKDHPCSKNPCKDNACTFIPEYSSVFHMARAGGFLPLLDVNAVTVQENGSSITIPMTYNSFDVAPPGGGSLQFWYDPNTTDNPDTSFYDERVFYSVDDIKSGKSEIKNLAPLSNWTAETRFYLSNETESRYVVIAVEYDAMPTPWTLELDLAGKTEQYFLNRYSLYYYHWVNGNLIAADENSNYTARIFACNLTRNFVLIDPELAAGVPSFAIFETGENYQDRYDFSGTPFNQVKPQGYDFMNVRRIGNLVEKLTIYYAEGSHSATAAAFNFINDESLKIGFFIPSIDGCPCPIDTITEGPPVPPDDPPQTTIEPTSSSRSSSRSSSKSSSRSSSSRSSQSSSRSSSQSEVPSNQSEVPSTPSEVPSNPSESSGPSNPSESSGPSNLVYILYSHEYACMYDEQSSSFVLQWTTSTAVYGTYIDPADAPYSDREIVHTGGGWALLFTIDGPVDYETAIAPEPPLILGSCTPDHPDCIEMIFDFPVGIIDSHSNEFSAPANYMIVTEYTPPVVVDDNGNLATFEVFLIDTVDWSEEIRFSAGSQHKLGYSSYSLEIRCRGTVTTAGNITFRFCPV